MNKFKKAFAIVELLLAVAVITVTSTVAYFIWEGTTRPKVRDAQRINDVNAVKLAVEAFYEKNNKYPPLGAAYGGQEYFYSSATQPWIPELVPEFIKELPKDPKQTSINIFSMLAKLFERENREFIKPVYAATGNVYRVDPTAGWQAGPINYPGSNPIDLEISPPTTPYRVLDASGVIYECIGDAFSCSWTSITGYPGSNPRDMSYFAPPFEGYFVLDGNGTIYARDGSGNWQALPTGGTIYPGTSPKNFEYQYSLPSGWIVLDADKNLYLLRNFPAGWSNLATGYPGTNPVDLEYLNGWKVLDTNGNIYAYDQGTNSWTTAVTRYPGSPIAMSSVALADSSLSYRVLGADGKIYTWESGAWQPFPPPSVTNPNYPGINLPIDVEETTVLEGTVPLGAPTPTPTPSPAPPFKGYLYYVDPTRKTYNVWAILENLKDPRINTMPTAQCKATPPPSADPAYNYCGSF